MTIGIKYCGGCNPGYDREVFVRRLKERFPACVFVTPEEQKKCDIWLFICGCPAACASGEGLEAGKGQFVVTSAKDFIKAAEYIKELESGTEKNKSAESESKNPVRGLRIGSHASMVKTFYMEDARKFALLTGDRNRLHWDQEFAAEIGLVGRPVVQGVLTGSLLSSVMGSELPGDGTIFMNEKLLFKKPVYFGDAIKARVTLFSCRETKRFYVGNLYGECRNQKDEVVVCGLFRQMMLRSMFKIENPGEIAEVLMDPDMKEYGGL